MKGHPEQFLFGIFYLRYRHQRAEG